MTTTALFEELFGVNAGYVEKVYGEYAKDPSSVGEEWVRFFDEHLPPELRVQPKPEEPAATEADEAAAEDLDPELEPLRGVAGRIVANMAQSLTVPTATSTRDVPVKVLEENRKIINLHRQAQYLTKISFTHLIGWAMVKALREVPAMTQSFAEVGGKAHRRTPEKVQLGIAVDLPGKDGRRSLVVPNVIDVLGLDFAGYVAAFDGQIQKARDGKLRPEDFAGTTCTLTNPGTIGTVSSLPRLMVGQAFILATGAIGVPAAYQGAAGSTLDELAVSKVMTLSSTYDHRVIQGAESGRFLAVMHQCLVGEHGFYEEIFRALRLPYRPVQFSVDRRSPVGSAGRAQEDLELAARVMQYIRMYRVRGYVLSDLNPLAYEPVDHPELDMASYGLTVWDKDREFFSSGVTAAPRARLRDIQAVLQKTYTRQVGVEYMHIADPEQREWLQQKMESSCNEEELGKDAMLRVLDSLIEAEAFERFLHTRFVGHKRFSLEGGETLIPAIEALLDRASELGVERAVLGMAHRGRLNVLAHVMGKSLEKIFREFEGWIDPDSAEGSGDVKYHLGAEGVYRTAAGGEVALELACNPSHLEAVNPVVEGMARARQDELSPGVIETEHRQKVLPVLVHGDAAFAGQGVVFETLNMSQLPGFGTGGTVHLIVNNQIGYTTLPEDSRSTPFCTDVAKGIQAPVFHVNGDNPLAAVRMVRLAMEYRERFGRDVVVDIVCYRRHGHNEGDEPSYTQPLLYKAIEAHPTIREAYQQYLLRAGVIGPEDVERSDQAVQDRLRQSLDAIRKDDAPASGTVDPWAEGPEEHWETVETAVAVDRLVELTDELLRIPEGYSPHPKLQMVLKRRSDMIRGEQPVDFALAETLAFASLVTDGVPVRLSGQDSGRGTFSQRHAVLRDVETGGKYVPLGDLADLMESGEPARFEVVDSFLSEEAVLGFEYGFATAQPHRLVLWEAQFGDFCNGAQIQIDQFLAAGEAKWRQRCGLVLLLPHGYDGQGPEHSSTRIERFLQLCAENNLRVANPSTAAQYFHLLRRQALSVEKKPLVVPTPKSLLRLKAAGSAPEDMATGRFAPVIDDALADKPERVVACSGKVYHDLVEARGDDASKAALVRVEQLYPWPAAELEALRKKYGNAPWYWCQEEPANMGAWSHVRWRFDWKGYAGRPAAASPATGSLQAHKVQQAALIERALGQPGLGRG